MVDSMRQHSFQKLRFTVTSVMIQCLNMARWRRAAEAVIIVRAHFSPFITAITPTRIFRDTLFAAIVPSVRH